VFNSPIMVFFQHHSLRPGSELFSFSRTSSIWSGALNHSTKEYTTGVMCFWPILEIRLNQLHKAGKFLELLLRQSKKMSAPPYRFRNIWRSIRRFEGFHRQSVACFRITSLEVWESHANKI